MTISQFMNAVLNLDQLKKSNNNLLPVLICKTVLIIMH